MDRRERVEAREEARGNALAIIPIEERDIDFFIKEVLIKITFLFFTLLQQKCILRILLRSAFYEEKKKVYKKTAFLLSTEKNFFEEISQVGTYQSI